MDIVLPIIIFFFIFVIVTLCGYCCKRKRDGVVYRYGGTGVTVTSASPVVVPPYPVEPRHPVPQTGPPPPGFAGAQPTTQQTHMVYPPPVGASPYPPVVAPYPPYPATTPYPPAAPYPPPQPSAVPPYSANPPSYSEAVSQPPITQEVYSKQAPYNPNFNQS